MAQQMYSGCTRKAESLNLLPYFPTDLRTQPSSHLAFSHNQPSARSLAVRQRVTLLTLSIPCYSRRDGGCASHPLYGLQPATLNLRIKHPTD